MKFSSENSLTLTISGQKIDLKQVLAIFFLVGSILSGQASLGRIIPIETVAQIDLKFLFFALALGCAMPISSVNWKVFSKPSFVLFALLCSCFIIRGLFDRGELGTGKIFDILLMLAQTFLLIALAGRQNFVPAISMAILLFALALLILEMFLLSRHVYLDNSVQGFGWYGVFGAISFNRVAFLAFCVTLSILCVVRPKSRIIVLFIVFGAALYLFATWGSLQKSAIAASVLVVILMLFGLFVDRRWREVMYLLGVILIAFFLTDQIFSERILNRVQVAFKDNPDMEKIPQRSRETEVAKAPATPEDKAPATPEDKAPATPEDKAPATPEEQLPGVLQKISGIRMCEIGNLDAENVRGDLTSFAKITVRYCYHQSASLTETNEGLCLRCFNKSLNDNTSRLALWVEAARGFSDRLLVGNGISTYQVKFISPYASLTVETLDFPHNLLFETAFETGIIGVSLLLLALGACSFAACRNTFTGGRIVVYALPLLGFSFFMFCSVMFSGDFYDSRFMWQMLLFLGVGIPELVNPQNDNPPGDSAET